MSELNEMGCDEFAAVAAELALGVLTGRERAEALAHLDGCDACRENIRQLTTVAEGLPGLLPTSEPPPGFETRVMERIGLAMPAAEAAEAAEPSEAREPGKGRPGRGARRGQWSGRTRRMLTVAAVTVMIVGAGLAGWGLHTATSTTPRSPLSSGTLLTASHKQAGEIYVYDGKHPWFYMAVDLPGKSTTVICQLVSEDGSITTVGAFQLVNGYGAWGSPARDEHGPVVAARLVAANGTVLATAALP